VQRALAGYSDAQSTLFARDRVRLFRTAFSLLRNKEDAEDALQDGLLRAHTKLASFQGRAQFSTWLTRIVINSALMNRRSLRKHPEVSLDQILANHEQAGPPVAISEGPDPEQWLAHVENREALEKRINLLSPPLRSALHLRDIQCLSTREAAKTESIKISVLKSRIFRARKRLLTLLKAEDVNL
jgi:RNA polymerase sigma-70 factor (ECF subfamily)